MRDVWQRCEAVVLKGQPSRIEIERDIWTNYSLAMIFPMHIPHWIPDSTISAWLWHVKATEPLPWAIDDEWLERIANGNESDDDD